MYELCKSVSENLLDKHTISSSIHAHRSHFWILIFGAGLGSTFFENRCSGSHVGSKILHVALVVSGSVAIALIAWNHSQIRVINKKKEAELQNQASKCFKSMPSTELQWMGLTPTASSQVGLYSTGIQQLTAMQTTVFYRRALMCYLSCILRLPVIVCIVKVFLYLPAFQMFSNVWTVFILTL